MRNLGFRIPIPPFTNLKEAVRVLHKICDLLYSLLIGGKVIGYEVVNVGSGAAIKLSNVPDGTVYALLVCEPDPTSVDLTKVVRYKQNGDNPTGSNGMPLGQLGVVEIKDPENLRNLRLIGIEPGKTHVINIEYYS